MKQSPKYANKWDKEKRNLNSFFHFNDGNYAEINESVESFDLKRWLKEIDMCKGI